MLLLHTTEIILLVFFSLLKSSVTLIANLNVAVTKLNDVIDLIQHRYELNNERYRQFLYVSGNIQKDAWDILKYKFMVKILSKGQFLMIFGGSSVTAGWDNLVNQSYPSIVEHHLSSIFEALQSTLVVRNIAQGNNNCRPYIYCYNALGGEHPDWIGWEQSYDCGRETSIHEMIARVAGWSKAVVYYSASGGVNTKDCLPSTDPVPWISEDWSPRGETSPPLPKYTPNLENVRKLREELHLWNSDGASVSKFTSALSDAAYKVCTLNVGGWRSRLQCMGTEQVPLQHHPHCPKCQYQQCHWLFWR